MGADAGVNRVELRSGSGHHSDANDRNQRGDQAIFNGGHAGVVSNETGDKLFHLRITPDASVTNRRGGLPLRQSDHTAVAVILNFSFKF
jgi:hypothetical protein